MDEFIEYEEYLNSWFDSVWEEALMDSIEKTLPNFGSLNRLQLTSSLDSEGQLLPPYAPTSRKAGNWRLFDKGDYYKSIRAVLRGRNIVWEYDEDKDEKIHRMEKAQGYDFIGLTDENEDKVIELIMRRFIDAFERYVNSY